jgi:hypothetical protein
MTKTSGLTFFLRDSTFEALPSGLFYETLLRRLFYEAVWDVNDEPAERALEREGNILSESGRHQGGLDYSRRTIADAAVVPIVLKVR